ncbi:MAG: spore maturation protein A [Oscillospiraceae bacterium]|nr:spore maturation protein A [Oscillospiraceae bacterium]
MGKFFFSAVIISILFGAASGNLRRVSNAALESSMQAAELSLELLGSLCFWSGIMEVAEKSGFAEIIKKILRPLLALFFPSLKKEEKAMEAISMNAAANLLGLGNAATPLGISAMRELSRISGFSSAATKEMVCFVVMNTASLQLVPTTIASIRLGSGAENPLDILPAVWFTSFFSLMIGMAAAKIGFPGEKKKWK